MNAAIDTCEHSESALHVNSVQRESGGRANLSSYRLILSQEESTFWGVDCTVTDRSGKQAPREKLRRNLGKQKSCARDKARRVTSSGKVKHNVFQIPCLKVFNEELLNVRCFSQWRKRRSSRSSSPECRLSSSSKSLESHKRLRTRKQAVFLLLCSVTGLIIYFMTNYYRARNEAES